MEDKTQVAQAAVAQVFDYAKTLPGFGTREFWVGLIGMGVAGLADDGFSRRIIKDILERSIGFYDDYSRQLRSNTDDGPIKTE